MSVLIDTGIFFGFFSKRDVHHLDSIILLAHALEGKWGRPYITEHILDETLTLLKYKISVECAVKFIEKFIESNNVEILMTSEASINSALKLFRKIGKIKGFSFTDAVSVVTVKENKLDLLMTYDTYLSSLVKTINANYVHTLPKDEIQRITNMSKTRMATRRQ